MFPPGSPVTSPVKTRTVIEKTTTTYETKMSPYSAQTSGPLPKKTPIDNEPIRQAAAPPLHSSAPDYSTPKEKPLAEDYYFNTPYQPTPQPDQLSDLPPARPPAPISAAETNLQFEEPAFEGSAPYPRKGHDAGEEDMDSRKSTCCVTFVV